MRDFKNLLKALEGGMWMVSIWLALLCLLGVLIAIFKIVLDIVTL